jgi:hypothetical protein
VRSVFIDDSRSFPELKHSYDQYRYKKVEVTGESVKVDTGNLNYFTLVNTVRIFLRSAPASPPPPPKKIIFLNKYENIAERSGCAF